MHLVYLHQYFLFPEDSGGTRSFDLSTSFVKSGQVSVEFITTSSFIKNYDFKDRWTLIERNGLKIHVLKLDYSNNLSYYKRSLIFIQFLWFSTFKLLKLNPDIVLATSTPLTIGIPALIKKWFSNTPYVFEVRDVWPEAVIAIGAIKSKFLQALLYKLEEVIYKNSSAIIPLSSGMRNSIVTRYPLLKKPIVTIPNIASIDRFKLEEKETKGSCLKKKIGFLPRFSILYAGTFGNVNGIDYVINLAKETYKEDKDLVFVLIGDGALKSSCIKKAKEFRILNKNVFILESIPKEELPLLYNEVSMGSSFVVPIKELWLNSANKFFDTLAAKKPILINYRGWQKKVIEENNIGYVLPEKLDKESISNFIEYTKKNELHVRQSDNAFKLAVEEYSLDIAVKKYLKIFNELR